MTSSLGRAGGKESVRRSQEGSGLRDDRRDVCTKRGWEASGRLWGAPDSTGGSQCWGVQWDQSLMSQSTRRKRG